MLAAFFETPQLWMLAGFLMLGWVLARRTIYRRKRLVKENRESKAAMKKLMVKTDPAVPLCDAPVETQRWQIAMFDLQRELKADLDTRIAVVQSLVRMADERIAELSRLESATGISSGPAIVTPGQLDTTRRQHISALSQSGYTAAEIAQKVGVAVGDVELTLSMHPV